MKFNNTSLYPIRRYVRFIFMAWVGLFAPQIHAESTNTHYSHATLLHVRADPHTVGTKPAGTLTINQAVTVLDRVEGRWCKIETRDALQGYVDCSFLHANPITLEQIDLEAAKIAIELNRQTLHIGTDSYEQYLNTDKLDVGKTLVALATQLERRFAVSPSLHTYSNYIRLLRTAKVDLGDAGERFASSRLGKLEAMRANLSQDYAVKSVVPVRYSISHRINLLLQQRRYGDVARRSLPDGPGNERGLISGDPQPADKASFFQKESWGAGWAGGSMIGRLRTQNSDGIAYSIGFDGSGPWVLADVYEMAKALHIPVKATFGKLGSDRGELSQQAEESDTLILDLRMPVWAITTDGLAAGTLRKVSYGGDQCTGNEKVPTDAEVVFSRPLKGEIHGVFASSAQIDPSRAKVSVRKRTILEALNRDGFDTTLTYRVDVAVDLDGDGVADLRSVVSNDTSVGLKGGQEILPAVNRGVGGFFIPAAGWYANDVYMLQANEDGWWRTLSYFTLSSCT
jgi:hypothetical protein